MLAPLPFLTGFPKLMELQLFYTAPSLCQLKIDSPVKSPKSGHCKPSARSVRFSETAFVSERTLV
jgi:hypothetical protein